MTSRQNHGLAASGKDGCTGATLSDADRAETIDRLYDVALDPARFEALLDHWESTVAPLRAHVEQARCAQIDMRAQRRDGAFPVIEQRLEPRGIERHVIEPVDGLGAVRVRQRCCGAAVFPRRSQAMILP